MMNTCPYCGKHVEHDGKDEYVQCPFCGEVSKYYFNKLSQLTNERGE